MQKTSGGNGVGRSEPEQRWRLADELLDIAKADTAFADLYLERARELMRAELTEEQYAGLERVDDAAAELQSRIELALQDGDWALVRDLGGRAAELKRTAARQGPLRAAAARVYRFDAVLVDPFSPGISGLAGVADRDLPAVREGAVKRLDRMRRADPAWAEMYAARRDALAALRLAAAVPGAAEGAVTAEHLQARAKHALAEGDLALVGRLAAQLLELGGGGAADAQGGPRAGLTPPLLERPFPPGVCDRAARVGLAAHRVESRAEDAVARFRPSWRATLGDPSGNTMRLALTVPDDAEEALRDAAELFTNRAFVTSAGTRYVPWMVAEHVLVEDFEAPTAASPLLAALGLRRRFGLSRRTVERVLRLRGGAVVEELGLDPREYRLVCVPADVFTRLGAELGWAAHERWTHFDGYMATNGRKLMALVGGDVRFGGVHDFVAVGAEYDSDRLLARFAVVQRRRFEMW